MLGARILPIVLFALGLAACASEPPDPAASAGSAGEPGSGGSSGARGGSGGAPPVCSAGPGYGDDPAPLRIDSVSATLVDQDGAPAPDLLVQVCGTDICVNGATGTTGAASVAPNVDIRKPAFKYGTGLDFARLAFLLDPQPVHDLGTITAVRLPGFAEGSPIDPGAEASSNGVVLSLSPGTAIRHDSLVYTTAEEQVFRAAVIPLPAQRLEPTFGLELIVALSPVETEFCPAARLDLPNTPGFEAATRVEFFALGVDIEEQWAPYAGWTKIGEGSVGDDATRIRMETDGISILYAAVGVRKKP